MIGILLNDASYEQDIRELLMAFYPGEGFAHERTGGVDFYVEGTYEPESGTFSLDILENEEKKAGAAFPVSYENRLEAKTAIKREPVSYTHLDVYKRQGEEKKKLVLNIGIGYSADLKKAKEILRRLFEEHPAILKEDGILVVVDSLGESSVNLSVRGWTLTEEYWTARWELTEAVKLAFDEEGIEIPYNYLNVHLTEKQKQSGQA